MGPETTDMNPCKMAYEGDKAPFDGVFIPKSIKMEEGFEAPADGEFCKARKDDYPPEDNRECKPAFEGDESPFDGLFHFKPMEVQEGWEAPMDGEFCPEGHMDDMKPPRPEDGERSGSEDDERKPVKEDHWSTTEGERGSGSDERGSATGNPCKNAYAGDKAPFDGVFIAKAQEAKKGFVAPADGEFCKPRKDDKPHGECVDAQEGDKSTFDGLFYFKIIEVQEGWEAPMEGEFCPHMDKDDKGDRDEWEGSASRSDDDEKTSVRYPGDGKDTGYKSGDEDMKPTNPCT